MTDEERRIISDFVGRVVAAEGEAVDADADRLLGELFQKHPTARYRIAQLAFFQEHALAEAQNQVKTLEWQLEQSKAQKGGMLGSLFGGSRPTGAPPQPIHAPNFRPGMFDPNQAQSMAPASPWARGQQGGARGGFLAGAAQTAVGVMGGMILGSMLADALGFGGGAAEAATPAEAPAEAEQGFSDTGFDSGGMDEEEF